MNIRLFFYDVEDGVLYELKKSKQKNLLQAHPNWHTYDFESNELTQVLDYFKANGKVIASTRERNVFVGYTA